MGISFRSYLEAKNVELLKHKLAEGKITAEECKEILKRLMLKGYEKEKAGLFGKSARVKYPELHVGGKKIIGNGELMVSEIPRNRKMI